MYFPFLVRVFFLASSVVRNVSRWTPIDRRSSGDTPCRGSWHSCFVLVTISFVYSSLTTALDLHRDHLGRCQPLQGGGDLLAGKLSYYYYYIISIAATYAG